jgi:hypothetical protein
MPLSPVLLPLTLNGIRAGTVIDDGMDDDAQQAAIWLPASATPIRPMQMRSLTETLIPYRQPAIMTDVTPPMSGAMPVHDAGAESKEAVQIPAADAGAVAEGNIVTRSFSKALWLLAAAGFVGHVAFVSKVREREDGDLAPKKQVD